MTSRLIKNDKSNPKFRVTPILLEGVEALPDEMIALAVNGIVKMSEIEHDFEKCLGRDPLPRTVQWLAIRGGRPGPRPCAHGEDPGRPSRRGH